MKSALGFGRMENRKFIDELPRQVQQVMGASVPSLGLLRAVQPSDVHAVCKGYGNNANVPGA